MALFGDEFVVSQPISVLLTENALHFGGIGEGVKIADLDGNLLFFSKDKRMGRDHETLFQAPGNNPVGTLQKKMMSMHHSWHVFRGESTDSNDIVATIEPRMINVLGKVVHITKQGEDNAFLTVKGNWRDKSFQYTDPNGNVVADTVVKGRFSGVVNFVTGDDSYILSVQPGYDLAFLVAITITLNDILNPDMA